MPSVRGRLRRIRVLEPLAERDFALLTVGGLISLLGDGFFYVALAWQVYELSNTPTALAAVGVAWTLPLVVFLLIGGVFSDRYERRRLMVLADLLRGLALAGLGALSIAGELELWHVFGLIALVGLGDAFFNPASTAIVPELLEDHLLPQANALQGLVRPLTVRLVGPALGGVMVGILGPGPAFVLDGATFVASAVAIGAIRRRPGPGAPDRVARGVRRTMGEIADGFRFVAANPWCWATLLSAMLSLLVFLGPVEVLVPFLVKNRLGLGPESLGAIFAAGGVGAIGAALLVGQLGQPRRRITAMFGAWSVGVALMAVYGLMTELWHALVASLLLHALFQLGSIIWVTLLQQLVPRGLLGRVSSLDWLVSTGLVPVSFALTGPAAAAWGPGATMVGAALLGSVLMLALLFWPGVRDPERRPLAADQSVPVG